MFTHVELDDDDDESAVREAGLPVTRPPGTAPRFAQPCAAFTSCCGIYDQRPARCRAFRCAVLRRLETGEIDAAAATSLVSSARPLADAARARLGAHLGDQQGGVADMAARVTREIEESPDPVAARVERLEVLAEYVALEILLRNHFRNRDDAAGGDGPAGDAE
jgi:hypothetical protein